MKTKVLLLLAGCAMALTGCLVTSVYPFYTAKDVVFDQALVGSWTNAAEADAEHWQFATDKTNTYQLTYITKDHTNVMQATLFKLQKTSFLDLFTPEISDENAPPPIPSHFLFRISQITPTLKMAAMDYEWLSKLVTQDPKAIRHHVIQVGDDADKNRLMLTADTAELQKFIIKHLDTKDAWGEPAELKKEASASKAAAKK